MPETGESLMLLLTSDQKIFVAKRIEKDVKKIAKRNGISEETAYEFYVKGCFI